MKVIGLIFILQIISFFSSAQTEQVNEKFALKRFNSNRIKYFERGTYLSFDLNDSCYEINCLNKKHYVNGQLVHVADTGITIDVTLEEYKMYFLDSILEFKLWADFVPVPNQKHRLFIPNERISMIKFQPNISRYSGIIGTIGFFSATIIAPIISINYKKGLMNSNVYFATLVPSLIISSSGFVSYFVFKTRKFKPVNSR
jgi:hypothetical protein